MTAMMKYRISNRPKTSDLVYQRRKVRACSGSQRVQGFCMGNPEETGDIHGSPGRCGPVAGDDN